VSRIELHNSTGLSDARLLTLCSQGLAGWSVGTITLRVRYSRGADFSGTCFYGDRRIHVNLGRHLAYPYLMATNLARARTVGRRWHKPLYALELKDAYQVVLFIFLHELYHLLVKRARRNTRQKESMCDRFAARFLVERFGVPVRAPDGASVPRTQWDFQDLDGFVAAARSKRAVRPPARVGATVSRGPRHEQLLLFEL
jgi:hypothetical protein